MLPVEATTFPPLFTSDVFDKILIVPPIEGTATFAAPKPLCTCIADVTSDNPAQLDQYTLPFSISFTGTPLIITATFSELNPRKLILPSPKPPPDFVAYTPGVDFKTSGNSWVPNFLSISAALIVETATGVFLSIANDVDVMIISSNVLPPSSNWIAPKLDFVEEKDISTVLYPIKETTNTPELEVVFNENFPSKSVSVPFMVPFSRTLAPGNDWLLSSTTVPEILVCPNTVVDTNINATNNKFLKFFINKFYGVKLFCKIPNFEELHC